MDLWYKPKYVIDLDIKLSDEKMTSYYEQFNKYEGFSALDTELYCNLFQIDVYDIILPNEKLEFNISEIFNDFITNHESDNFKKLAKIEDFNITFYINDDYNVAWPREFEELMIKDVEITHLLSYDEFIIKSILE